MRVQSIKFNGSCPTIAAAEDQLNCNDFIGISVKSESVESLEMKLCDVLKIDLRFWEVLSSYATTYAFILLQGKF